MPSGRDQHGRQWGTLKHLRITCGTEIVAVDIHIVLHFEAAARHLSFRSAAEELNVTHAAVSHQIRALEERFGVQLFNRITRGVTLTDDAGLVMAFAVVETGN